MSAHRPGEKCVAAPERALQRLSVAVPEFFISNYPSRRPVNQTHQLGPQWQVQPDDELCAIHDQPPQLAVVVPVDDPTAIVVECCQHTILQLRGRCCGPIGPVVQSVELDPRQTETLCQLEAKRRLASTACTLYQYPANHGARRLAHHLKPLAPDSCTEVDRGDCRPTTACSGRNLAALGVAAEVWYVGRLMIEGDVIAVRRLGVEGPVVVVLHGGPGAPGSARGLARLLSESFQVLEPLQRRRGSQPLTVAQHVADLVAVTHSPALIVGHSWGAMLGLSFASRHPACVARLVLVGCGTYDETTRSRLNSTISERLGPDGTRRADALLHRAEHEASPALRNAALRQLGAMYAELETYAPVTDDVDDTESLPTDATGHAETWKDVLRLQRDGVEPAAFSEIRAPVLMIHGDQDPHPGAATRDFLRKYIPQLEYLELPRCGHEPWRELHAREAFAAALCDWLSRPSANAAQQAVEAVDRASS